MLRPVAAFGIVASVLLGAVAACGTPMADVANPSAPQAQATSVRRTVVAAAQAVIANNPTPTSTLPPTPIPSPSCQTQGAIWWFEARSHVGESRTVQGTIVGSRPAPGGLALLELGQPYADPTSLGVLIPASQGSSFEGKSVCVAGRIAVIEGRVAMQLPDSSSIRVMN